MESDARERRGMRPLQDHIRVNKILSADRFYTQQVLNVPGRRVFDLSHIDFVQESGQRSATVRLL